MVQQQRHVIKRMYQKHGTVIYNSCWPPAFPSTAREPIDDFICKGGNYFFVIFNKIHIVWLVAIVAAYF
jgi:hypothetical protein